MLTGLDGGPPAPAPVLGDEAKLRQVLGNLVGNALRYTPEGTPIEIAVGGRTAADGNRQSVIEVRDHGPGVPAEEAARIFERFYRADMSRSRDEGGTGLGLSIVKHLVEAHGGRVSAESELGVGTVIRVWFPETVGTRDRTAADEPFA